MPDVFLSLQQQLEEAETNLRLIQERKAEFVESEHIPLDLIKNEHATEALIADLLARLSQLRDLPCPYRGLRAFETTDAEVYFGRTAMTATLVTRVRQSSFIAVVGASGSGKSSLVRAGLVHTLGQSGEPWRIGLFTPGRMPLRALAACLVDWLLPDGTEGRRQQEIDDLADYLQRDTATIAQTLTRIGTVHPGASLLLLVDQFEELFTQGSDMATQERFTSALLDAAELAGPVHIVLAMRADFYAHVLRNARLGAAFDRGQVNVLPLTRDDLHAAIEQPALQRGRTFEPGLVERILDDIATEPGNLPLLQFALTELWARQAADGTLTHVAYEALGGVEQALAGYAEQVFAQFSADEQAQVQRILLQLVQPGAGTTDTRRLASRDDLDDTHWDLVTRLADTRLLVTRRDTTEVVEVAHEALIRNWQRLHHWIDTDRTFRTWQERLRTDMHQWKEQHQDNGLLLRGAALAEAQAWLQQRAADLSAQEEAYIQASGQARHRTLLVQWGAIAAMVLLVVAVLAAVALGQSQLAQERQLAVATVQAQQATTEAERVRAEANATEALSRLLAADARTALDQGNTDYALTLALAANRVAPTVAQAQDMLQRAGAAASRRILHVSMDEVWSVTFSADGQMALAASCGRRDHRDDCIQGELILWDVVTGEQRHIFRGHTAWIMSVAFSPDGQTALSGSADNTLRLWDIARGKEARVFRGHTNHVTSIAFSPDGQTALSGSADGTVRLWDVETGEERRVFTGHTAGVTSIAFSPDGQTALSGSGDQTLRLWNVATGEQVRVFRISADEVRSIAFSPDGRTVLSGACQKPDGFACRQSELILWDIALGKQERVFRGSTDGVTSVTFSSDGQLALSTSCGHYDGVTCRQGELILWDVATGEQVRIFRGHTNQVAAIAFSSDGQTALSISWDATLRLWDVATGEEQRVFRANRFDYMGAVMSVAFSPDGQTVLSGSQDRTLRLWDVATGEAVRTFSGPSAVESIALNPDGKTALSGSADGTVQLWDVEAGEERRVFTGHALSVNSVAFSPDGNTALSGSEDQTLWLWDVSTGEQVRVFTGHADSVTSVAFSPDGQTILSGSCGQHDGLTCLQGELILWNVATGEQVRVFTGHPDVVTSVAFSPDGQTALSSACAQRDASGGCTQGELIVWDVAQGSAHRTFHGHTNTVRSVAFSPDGRYALSGSQDTTVRLWDIATGEQQRVFTGHTNAVTSVAFSPDGQTVLSGSADGTVRLWKVATLPEWICANRSVPSLTVELREQYRLPADLMLCPGVVGTAE